MMVNPQPLHPSLAPTGPGVWNTGIPGIEVAAFEKWLVISSPQWMWPTGDLNQVGGEAIAPVILILDLSANPPAVWNTGLIGYRPDIARTPDGAVTVAFEVDEEFLIPRDVGGTAGYPNISTAGPGVPPGCSIPGCFPLTAGQDANGDGDFIDRVIVLYTWVSGPSGPPIGATRIFAPRGNASGDASDIQVFTRASLSGSVPPSGQATGYLVHEFGVGEEFKTNPRTDVLTPGTFPNKVPSIYVWDLRGLTGTTPPCSGPGAIPPTQQIYADLGAPAPTVLPGCSIPPCSFPVAGGYRPHVATRPDVNNREWLTFEQHEAANFGPGIDLTGDMDSDDYVWRRRIITGSMLGTCNVTVGHPSASCTVPQCVVQNGRLPILGGDQIGAETNLTTTMDEVDGVPFLNGGTFDPRGTFFGDDAIRRDRQFPGVLTFSTFGGFVPPVAGAGSEREVQTCLDERIGFALPLLGTATTLFPVPDGFGLYPSGAGNQVAFTTREFANNPGLGVDLNGDGRLNTVVRRIRFDPTSGASQPAVPLGCGYGATMDDEPGFSVGGTPISFVTAFLTPERCIFVDATGTSPCAPPPQWLIHFNSLGMGCLASNPFNDNYCVDVSLNLVNIQGAPSDNDENDIIVRYELQ